MAAPRRKVDMVDALPALEKPDPSRARRGCRPAWALPVRDGTRAACAVTSAGTLDRMTDPGERDPGTPEDDRLPADEDVQAARDALPSQEPGDEDQSGDGTTRDAADDPFAQ